MLIYSVDRVSHPSMCKNMFGGSIHRIRNRKVSSVITGDVYTIGSEATDTPQLRLYHSVVHPCQRPYEEHRHTAFELSLICAGRGTYRAGAQSYCFQPGDVFLFSSNEPHCIVEVFGGSVLDIMNLQFEPRFLWSPENLLFQVHYPDIFFNRNEKYSHLLASSSTSGNGISNGLRAIEQEFQQKKTDYKLMVKLQVLELLVLIRREYADCFREPLRPVNASYLAQMEHALDYIDRNLTGELQLGKVAKEAAMSPAYFSSLFKKLNGMTLWEYVQSRRIEMAVDRLISTDKNVTEIAMECGYNSISNFNRSFKTITGQTPVAYRKLNRDHTE